MVPILIPLIPLIALAAQALSAPLPESWKLEETKDGLTGEKHQRLSFPGKGGELILICQAGSAKARLIIYSDSFVGGARVREIAYRLGAIPAQKSLWRYGNDHAAEPIKSDELNSILTTIVSQPDAFFRMVRYDFGTSDVAINLSGVADGLKAWRAACGIGSEAQLKADPG